MKNMIKENADVLGLNSVSLSISFTTLHQTLQITLLLVSIIYTVDRFMYYRNKENNFIMEELLKLIEQYGLSMVLLIGCLYVLYQFTFFSIKEVKKGFEKRHEVLHEQMNDVKEKLNIILEFIKEKK